MIGVPTVLDEAPSEPGRFVSASRVKRDRPLNEQKNGPFGRPAVTFLVLALPALWIGWLIFRYGVDTPWGDEWDSTLPLLEKMQAGTLGWADFFAFHNEHRIFFPRLLTFGLARLTDWNVRAELLVIWLLACACSFNLWRMALATLGSPSLLVIAISLSVSPAQASAAARASVAASALMVPSAATLRARQASRAA